MAGTKSPAAVTDEERAAFKTFAPSALPVQGEPFYGTFSRLLVGPENEFGRPLIVEFVAEKGVIRTVDGGPLVTVTPGETYGLWLLHETLLNGFKESRPEKGERFGVLYSGQRVKKAALKAGRDGTDKEDRYHDYSVILPDRPVADDETSWEALS
jgi:hypothetical protein